MSGDGSVYWNAFQCSISNCQLTRGFGSIPFWTRKIRKETRVKFATESSRLKVKKKKTDKQLLYQDLTSPRPTSLLRGRCPTPPPWLSPRECRWLLAPHPRTFCAQTLCLCLTPTRSTWNSIQSMSWRCNGADITTVQEWAESSACWESTYLHRLLIDFVRPPAKFV